MYYVSLQTFSHKALSSILSNELLLKIDNKMKQYNDSVFVNVKTRSKIKYKM